MRALVWLRADLRTDDNRALHAACAAATHGVVAVFVICAEQWRRHDWAARKVAFLLRNLHCLRGKLAALNIPLLIRETPRFDGVPDALLTLARTLRCDALYFNREYEVHEQRRDAQVAAAFAAEGRVVRAFDDQTILPPDAVHTTDGRFYTVFTPFKRAWIAAAERSDAVAPRGPVKRQAEAPCPADVVPDAVAGCARRPDLDALWPAGEDHALRQLREFIARRIQAYHDRRDLPAQDATSRLSPYLTLGVLSPRRCLAEARAAGAESLADGPGGPRTWISELVWREFYRHVLVGYPHVCMHRAFKRETDQLPWRDAEREFAAWCIGRTGCPIVDAGMRQLAATGWMHNRVRMIVAMFLTKDLFIDWRRGEQFFMQHLVDGDLASNNGGWQWSASTGTDAAPYFRIFNPWSQAAKFDPRGQYIHQWVPELRDVPAHVLHDPRALDAAQRRQRDYPEPICDHAAARAHVLAVFKRLRG